MVILLLDLDLTAIATKADSVLVNPVHTLSNHGLSHTFNLAIGTQTIPFELINPEHLSQLIETACKDYDGVMILTSGYWPKSILIQLAAHLDITDETEKKFVDSIFHSAITDHHHFLSNEYSAVDRIRHTKTVSKKLRLDKIIECNPKLINAHFVFVDDNVKHINDFKGHERVTPVLATTQSTDKTFYSKAQDALAEARKKQAVTPKHTASVNQYTLFGESQFNIDLRNATIGLTAPQIEQNSDSVTAILMN